ncbi:Wadjet anti-phage system protein JetA family protein [Prosthecobacter fluviatilis]|uniref:Wadjet anti-phage system protein JetA family protein n=1 Tax=Prosthecobacter fluviatilis TaxID=445931 RepID=A0ABW0KRZ5_9BACT
MSDLLSTSLYREVRDPAFFRVLAGKNAPTYVDVLDALDRECGEQPDGLDRSDAIEIIAEVLARHPEFQPEEDEPAAEGEQAPVSLPPREAARRVLDHLARCRWLEEPPRKDWKRRLYFDAHGSTLIAALRQIAHPEAAVFTDKLTAVCAALANEPELIERPLQTVDVCLSNTRQGLGELRTMQKSVQRLTRRQLEEDTLKGNLALVFEDYAEQIAHGAYAELIRARLPARLPEAVRRISDRLQDDSSVIAEMQTELLRREPTLSAETARARVRQRLDDLAHLLELVQPMADEIDRRTADFTRRSLSRFRYLQDVTGERRGEIRNFFQTVNGMLSGKRLSSAWEVPALPALRLPETRMPAGLDSLYAPPTRRTTAEQAALDDEVSDAERDEGLRGMARALRDSLSVRRANEFVKRIPGEKGARISSADLPVASEADLTELIALLLHAESNEASYKIESTRAKTREHAGDISLDALPGARVEHFDLIKK